MNESLTDDDSSFSLSSDKHRKSYTIRLSDEHVRMLDFLSNHLDFSKSVVFRIALLELFKNYN